MCVGTSQEQGCDSARDRLEDLPSRGSDVLHAIRGTLLSFTDPVAEAQPAAASLPRCTAIMCGSKPQTTLVSLRPILQGCDPWITTCSVCSVHDLRCL